MKNEDLQKAHSFRDFNYPKKRIKPKKLKTTETKQKKGFGQ